MGKGANKNLMANAGQGQQMQTTLANKAQGIGDFATPKLESQFENPQGYSPQQMAYMQTASEQSLGGSGAATTGQANLEAARTRNAGGFQTAVGDANRSNARQLSENAVGIQSKQADMQMQQKQQALQALMSLYGVDESTALGYLNSSNNALSEENKSHPNQEGLKTAGTFIKDLTPTAG